MVFYIFIENSPSFPFLKYSESSLRIQNIEQSNIMRMDYFKYNFKSQLKYRQPKSLYSLDNSISKDVHHSKTTVGKLVFVLFV